MPLSTTNTISTILQLQFKKVRIWKYIILEPYYLYLIIEIVYIETPLNPTPIFIFYKKKVNYDWLIQDS